MKTSNKVLVLMAAFLFLFVIGMVAVFCIKDAVPDVLITCVFAACTGELSVLGWIKTTKTKNGEEQNEDAD